MYIVSIVNRVSVFEYDDECSLFLGALWASNFAVVRFSAQCFSRFFFSILFCLQAFLVSSFPLCCCVNKVFIPSYGLYELFYILYWGEMMMVHEVV